jgi:aminoglycoside phosphotransferase (APT) family kinase protein
MADAEVDEIFCQVAVEFGLGDISAPAAYIDGGVSGEVFKITTPAGDWAVKRLHQQPNLEQLEIEIGLKEAAGAAGVVSPATVRTPTGDVVVAVAGRHWLASVWTEVSRDAAALAQPDRLAQVGEIVAILHNLRRAARHDVTPWLTTPPGATEWERLRSVARASTASWSSTFEELYPEFLRLAEFSALAVSGAAVLSHCDLGPANFGAAADHLVVFDWERAGATRPAQELGYVLTQWVEVGDPAVVLPPIVAGYRARRIEQIVVNISMFAYAANAFLNFLASSIDARNERRTGQTLERPVTIGLLQSLTDIAAAS